MSKQFMTMTDFCARVHTDVQTLKKAQNEGFIKPHHTTPSGRRYYSENEIEMWDKYLHRYDNYFDTEQFAEAVYVAKTTVERWRRKKWLLPAFTAHNKHYYTQEQVDSVLSVKKG